MDPKQFFLADKLSDQQIAEMREAGISGMVEIGDFVANFRSIEDRRATVKLTSGGVWVVVIGEQEDRVMFVEQTDRAFPDGRHPWEIASGHAEPGLDANIYQTCIREVQEELGFPLQNLQPIAIAIKREESELPVIVSLPTHDNQSLWVEESLLWSEQELKGGLICVSTINVRQLPYFLADFYCRRFPGQTVMLPTPPGVNANEISQVALVPLEHIIERSSSLLFDSSHMWAQADGFRAFVVSANFGN